jgi:hypothetical protein
MLKLDIARAFDSVSWGRLCEVLCKLDSIGSYENGLPSYCLWRAQGGCSRVSQPPPHLCVVPMSPKKRGPLSSMLFVLVINMINMLEKAIES